MKTLHPIVAAGIALAALFASVPARSQTVAVAANAKGVAAALTSVFEARPGGMRPTTVVGSSGVLAAQIRSGAPFDLFLSADTSYPAALWREGRAERPRIYAYGRLILWSKRGVPVARGLACLTDPAVRTVAVANPVNAPFGAAAIAALRSAGLYERVAAKIVYGESVAQVNQYVDAGVVDVGLTSASALRSVADTGAWAALDSAAYPAIPLGAVLVRRGAPEGERLARAFLDFLGTEPARAILARWGYGLP